MSTIEIIAFVVSIVALIAAVINVSLIIARAKKEREEKRLRLLAEQRLRRPIVPDLGKAGRTAFYAQLAAHGIHLQPQPETNAETREAFDDEQTERKTPEEIKRALQICATGLSELCDQCSYTGKGCDIKLTRDAFAFIEFLERSERYFAEQWYNLNDNLCGVCIHCGKCDSVGTEEGSEEEIPREKCIEGVIAFKRKEWEEQKEQKHENG